MRRRALLASPALLAACTRTPPPQPFLLVELTREARIDGDPNHLVVSACQWHVNRAGVLYGDHWGWCEDYMLLPRDAPGYLLLTTNFAGGAAGGYARLLVLPPLPGSLGAFGHTLALALEGKQVALELRGQRATLAPSQTAPLGGEPSLVEPPVDTGHFEPAFDQPLLAQVSYTVTHHGWLDARRIAGRRV